jgi:hypothetical protein
MTATAIGMFSRTQVASSWMVIWKQPSPSIDHTVASGRRTFAPMAAGTEKPICAEPLAKTKTPTPEVD